MCAADLGVNHVPYNVVQFLEYAMEWGWGGVRNSIAVLEGTTKWGGGGGQWCIQFYSFTLLSMINGAIGREEDVWTKAKAHH